MTLRKRKRKTKVDGLPPAPILYFGYEHSYAREELCEVSGGDQVAAAPPRGAQRRPGPLGASSSRI
eukprot:3612176-Pyramimonas_sp.AAC.1